MSKILTTLAALALSVALTAGPSTQAKADGGAVAIGVGAYLIVDAVVGRRCDQHEWPFNIIRKIGDELHHRDGCHHHRHHHHRHHHHHHHHHRYHR
jgi:hypothetical protein